MKLSSFTQYYIRKLLRHYLKTQSSRIPFRNELARYFDTDLGAILECSGKTKAEVLATINKIETLVLAHHEQELSGLYDRQSLFKLEQQIFELVGLKLYSSTPAMLLVTVEERATAQFKFFLANQLQRGLRYKNVMYGFILESKCGYEPSIFQLIAILAEQEIPFIVTNSQTRLAVWVNLKSPAYITLTRYGLRLINTTVNIQSKMRKLKPSNLKHSAL